MKAKRPAKCCARGCGKPAQFFGPRNGLKKQLAWCSDECGASVAMLLAQRNARDKAKRERAEHVQRKKAIERPRDLLPRAKAAVHWFIRERDHGLPCISCGRNDDEIRHDPCGGTWDAGHFLSVGSTPALRFEPLNINRQCKNCNRDKSGNATRYEQRLIERIGADKVAWLKGPHAPKKWTVDELREIQKHYNAEARRLVRERVSRLTPLADARQTVAQ